MTVTLVRLVLYSVIPAVTTKRILLSLSVCQQPPESVSPCAKGAHCSNRINQSHAIARRGLIKSALGSCSKKDVRRSTRRLFSIFEQKISGSSTWEQ